MAEQSKSKVRLPPRLAPLDHVRNLYKDTANILPRERKIKKKQDLIKALRGAPTPDKVEAKRRAKAGARDGIGGTVTLPLYAGEPKEDREDPTARSLREMEAMVNNNARVHNDAKRDLAVKRAHLEKLRSDLQGLQAENRALIAPAETPEEREIEKLTKQIEAEEEVLWDREFRKRQLDFMLHRLRNNAVTYDSHIKSMDEALKAAGRELKEVKRFLRVMQESKETANVELKRLQKQAKADEERRQRQLGTARDVFEKSIKSEAWRKEREEVRAALAAELAGDMTAAQEEALIRRKEDRDRELEELRAETRRWQDRGMALDGAFERMRTLTGETEVDQIVQRFLDQQQTRVRLDADREEAERRLAGAKDEVLRAREELRMLCAAGTVPEDEEEQAREAVRQATAKPGRRKTSPGTSGGGSMFLTAAPETDSEDEGKEEADGEGEEEEEDDLSTHTKQVLRLEEEAHRLRKELARERESSKRSEATLMALHQGVSGVLQRLEPFTGALRAELMQIQVQSGQEGLLGSSEDDDSSSEDEEEGAQRDVDALLNPQLSFLQQQQQAASTGGPPQPPPPLSQMTSSAMMVAAADPEAVAQAKDEAMELRSLSKEARRMMTRAQRQLNRMARVIERRRQTQRGPDLQRLRQEVEAGQKAEATQASRLLTSTSAPTFTIMGMRGNPNEVNLRRRLPPQDVEHEGGGIPLEDPVPHANNVRVLPRHKEVIPMSTLDNLPPLASARSAESGAAAPGGVEEEPSMSSDVAAAATRTGADAEADSGGAPSARKGGATTLPGESKQSAKERETRERLLASLLGGDADDEEVRAKTTTFAQGLLRRRLREASSADVLPRASLKGESALRLQTERRRRLAAEQNERQKMQLIKNWEREQTMKRLLHSRPETDGLNVLITKPVTD